MANKTPDFQELINRIANVENSISNLKQSLNKNESDADAQAAKLEGKIDEFRRELTDATSSDRAVTWKHLLYMQGGIVSVPGF